MHEHLAVLAAGSHSVSNSAGAALGALAVIALLLFGARKGAKSEDEEKKR